MKCLMVALILTLLLGCSRQPPPTSHKFHKGQLVKAKLDGLKMQITYVYTSSLRYKCRVGGLHQSRRDGLLSQDTELVRYNTVVFEEFELEPFTE